MNCVCSAPASPSLVRSRSWDPPSPCAVVIPGVSLAEAALVDDVRWRDGGLCASRGGPDKNFDTAGRGLTSGTDGTVRGRITSPPARGGGGRGPVNLFCLCLLWWVRKDTDGKRTPQQPRRLADSGLR
ncbi:hypothetical protein CCHR01_13810 [Colletotrichum chrysophilum]|uniref:Uncharacterized protein n=1 Tax=Colletotrichum chrysophilum TaxID=1836956 RepID=A0AAD9ABG7_9PEZI|nr:hypothetical protein CCHR01_13810 [Colletotrichum chrysophilum]